MSSSWLKDYVLEGLGFEIRKASLLDNETTTESSTANGTTKGQARLVQILGRGQERFESNIARNSGSLKLNSTLGNDWWNPSRRGKSPNLAKHTNAWILVSDGSYSAKLYLATEALKEIFDLDNRNNNEDNLFRRGCCVMLKTYSFDCGVDNQMTINDHQCSQHYGHSVNFKVSSLEPKPGFNFHQGAKTNNASHSDKNSETIIQPVMEETDVLYGLQFLAQQRQQQARIDLRSCTTTSASIARDWDIAFGRLSKGRLTDEEAKAIRVVDGKRGLDDILKLAEAAASTDEAIRDWEIAKKEFGITVTDSTNNDKTLQAQKQMATPTKTRVDGQDGDQEYSDQDQEALSRMYIQNVLATPDKDEDDNENDKSNEDPSTGEEEPMLPETQPNEISTRIESDRGEKKILSSGKKKGKEYEDSEILNENLFQTQPAEEEEKEPGKNTIESTRRMRRKRLRANSFESGTASNLTLDEAISPLGSTRKSINPSRRRQKQQLMLQQQQNSRNSTGIWESVKEQLFEPGRTILYCGSSCRMPSGSGNNDDENMRVTPKRSPITNAKNLGSGASIGTNFTSWTPNPSSGAYYRKYGLARWLSQNTNSDERG